MKLTYDKVFQRASNDFLTKQVPDNWCEMDEEEQDEFINTHKWHLMEQASPGFVIDLIENSTAGTIEFLKAHGVWPMKKFDIVVELTDRYTMTIEAESDDDAYSRFDVLMDEHDRDYKALMSLSDDCNTEVTFTEIPGDDEN